MPLSIRQFHLWFMWAIAVGFFAYQFILRLMPGLVMHELMGRFSITATEFGFLSSAYYLGYAGMQIPVSVMLDRFGPRRVVASCALVSAAAAMVFVVATRWEVVLVARFLIGAGSAAGFLGASKVASLWFPPNRYATLVGFSFTFGLMGAVYGGRPIAWLMAGYGWEKVVTGVAAAGFGIAVLLIVGLKDPSERPIDRETSLSGQLVGLLRNRRILAIAASNMLMVGSLEGFADVWGVSYLSSIHPFGKAEAAGIISAVFVGMLFGGPLLASIASRTNRYYEVTGVAGLIMAAMFTGIFVLGARISTPTLYVLMFLVGILCCYQVLVFAIGSSLSPQSMKGITIAFLNCVNMLGGLFFHSVIGRLMDFFWTGGMQDGVRVYDGHAYERSLGIIPLAAAVGGCVFLLLPGLTASVPETSADAS